MHCLISTRPDIQVGISLIQRTRSASFVNRLPKTNGIERSGTLRHVLMAVLLTPISRCQCWGRAEVLHFTSTTLTAEVSS